jgi:hypothetical protein
MEVKRRTFLTPLLLLPVIALALIVLRPGHTSIDYAAIEKQVATDACDPANYSIVTDGTHFRVKSLSGVGFIEYDTRAEAQKAMDFAVNYSRREYRAKYETDWVDALKR